MHVDESDSVQTIQVSVQSTENTTSQVLDVLQPESIRYFVYKSELIISKNFNLLKIFLWSKKVNLKTLRTTCRKPLKNPAKILQNGHHMDEK